MTSIFALQCIAKDEIRRQKTFNQVLDYDEYFSNLSEEIQRISTKVNNHEFICLGTVKPDIVDNNIINITESKNKENFKKKY